MVLLLVGMPFVVIFCSSGGAHGSREGWMVHGVVGGAIVIGGKERRVLVCSLRHWRVRQTITFDAGIHRSVR